jgi:hypothetical protein
MRDHYSWRRALAVAAVLLLGVSGVALAQLQSGNLFGTVVDEQGNPLPGATVTLSGPGARQVQVTDAQGDFRFLQLSPAGYKVEAQLEGFSTIEYPNVVINVGRNTTIEITLSSAVEDVITVTAESPLLDERKISTGATVSAVELEKIPTARDPWAVLQQVPGVLTDRINVGGNESGQQSQYVGPGSDGSQAVWSVDGVTITDMAATGSSPSYYDFDAFEEMQVTTGGTDVTVATGGVVLNMVTKRGTNEWRGSGRYFVGDDDWQSDLDFSESDLGRPGRASSPDNSNQASFKQGNRIVKVEDFGAEIGGPIVRDRLWIWGSYGENQIDLLTIADVADATTLETKNLKLNAQIAANNSATAFYTDNEKLKIGRNAGPTRPQPTTWNQSGFGDTPTAWKLEDTHIFSSAFYLTGMYSQVNGGFQLVPQGGLSVNSSLDEDFIWQNSFLLYQSERPQEQYKIDGSNFFNTGSVSHELKFGAGYREQETGSLSRWPGVGFQEDYYRNYVGYGYPFIDAGYSVIALTRDAFPAYKQEYQSAYLQDTLTVGNLTANLGLRYDLQDGALLPRTVRANQARPDLLPSTSVRGGDIGFEWESITPRLGLTYALGAERKTLLRASFSQFADQLGAGGTTQLSLLYPGAYVYVYYRDDNNNGQADASEITNNLAFGGFNFIYNPHNPGVPLQSNSVDPNLDPPTTNELLFGVEHALLPEFVVGLNFTYRQLTDLLEYERLVFDESDPFSETAVRTVGRVHRRSDYVPFQVTGTLPNGQPYNVTAYELRPGVSSRGGNLLQNGDREQIYKGVSATFNKRLANRWMLRGNLSWQDWTWDVPDSENEDPSPPLGGGCVVSPAPLVVCGGGDGDIVLQGSGTGSGSKGGIYINSTWSYSVNGMYQIAPDRPWGFNAALNLTGREGYPIPYFRRVGRDGLPGTFNVQVVDPDDFRNDDVHIVDARLEKEFTFSDVGLTLSADVFNLFNESYVLQRIHRLERSNSDHVTEITSPRILRLGLRLSFR